MQTAFRSEERFTQDEFVRWLEQRPASDIHHYELLDGHIVMTPPAGHPHGTVEGQIIYLLQRHVRAGNLGIVNGSSTGYALPLGQTLEPDVSFVSSATLAAGPAPEVGKFLRIVPDLVVEILSESTESRDLGEKRSIYERNGVAEYWLVAPQERQVTVLYRDGGTFSTSRTFREGAIASHVLPELSLTVEAVFELV
ncbi:MAG TPA: Uma2 family endonuclease [Candidatus Binatia bacterium]|nr:Uma2 family endonuclease [Candidatus Binatia bacterium]